MLATEIKRFAYDPYRLGASKGEHKTPEHLEMDPRGKVPMLKDGDMVVYESITIFTCLESKYSEPSLFGTTPKETGKIWQRVSEVTNYVRSPIADDIIAPLFQGRAKANAIRDTAGPARDALK
jgi:glutathione S-transferase